MAELEAPVRPADPERPPEILLPASSSPIRDIAAELRRTAKQRGRRASPPAAAAAAASAASAPPSKRPKKATSSKSNNPKRSTSPSSVVAFERVRHLPTDQFENEEAASMHMCIICHRVSVAYATMGGCLHRFCADCFVRDPQRTRALSAFPRDDPPPVMNFDCKAGCGPQQVLVHNTSNGAEEQLVAQLRVRCTACGDLVELGHRWNTYYAHVEQTCPQRKEPCILCREPFTKEGLEAHMEAGCGAETATCVYCDEEILRRDKPEHFDHEPGVPCRGLVTCPNGCTKRQHAKLHTPAAYNALGSREEKLALAVPLVLKRTELPKHLAEECALRQQPCPVPGCAHACPVHLMAEHTQQAQAEHLQALAATVRQLQQQAQKPVQLVVPAVPPSASPWPGFLRVFTDVFRVPICALDEKADPWVSYTLLDATSDLQGIGELSSMKLVLRQHVAAARATGGQDICLRLDFTKPSLRELELGARVRMCTTATHDLESARDTMSGACIDPIPDNLPGWCDLLLTGDTVTNIHRTTLDVSQLVKLRGWADRSRLVHGGHFLFFVELFAPVSSRKRSAAAASL